MRTKKGSPKALLAKETSARDANFPLLPPLLRLSDVVESRDFFEHFFLSFEHHHSFPNDARFNCFSHGCRITVFIGQKRTKKYGPQTPPFFFVLMMSNNNGFHSHLSKVFWPKKNKIPFPPLLPFTDPPPFFLFAPTKKGPILLLRNTFCTEGTKGVNQEVVFGFWSSLPTANVFFFPSWNTFTYLLYHQSSHIKERAKVHIIKNKRRWFCVGTTQKSSS